jgi:hypothetical protein
VLAFQALALWLLAAAVSPSDAQQQQRLADEIERLVVLPPHARPLSVYGRNYARSGNEVVAVYLIPRSPVSAREGCETMTKDFHSRPCTKREIQDLERSEALELRAQTPAGVRRWYKTTNELPGVLDGGCMQVNVRYQISTRRILLVSCNGLG